MTNRQESRLITMIKIHVWKIKNRINNVEANTIRKDDLQKSLDLFVLIVEEKLKIIHNKTQLDYFKTEKSPQRLEYVMNQIVRAVKWEIATSPEVTKIFTNLQYANNTSLRNEDIIELKEAIAKGLGVRYHPNTFDREKQVEYYRNEIVTALETTDDRVAYILDDIKKLCEYDSVLGAIHNCIYVSALPKRDRKKIYEEKMKFERMKCKTIEGLKFLKLPYEDVEKRQYSSDEEYGWVNYERTLKHIKKVLQDDLTLICGTGKRRADAITKILEYL